MKLMKILKSNRGQISLEFSILLLTVITATAILGYYLLSTSLNIKKTNIEMINHSANVAKSALSRVT